VTDSTVSAISYRQAANRFEGSRSLSISPGDDIALAPFAESGPDGVRVIERRGQLLQGFLARGPAQQSKVAELPDRGIEIRFGAFDGLVRLADLLPADQISPPTAPVFADLECWQDPASAEVEHRWAAYYRTQVSAVAFGKLDYYLWRLTWKWATRSHANKPTRWVFTRYLGKFNKARQDRWVFGDRTSGAFMHRFAWTNIVRHTIVKHAPSPDDPRACRLLGLATTESHAADQPHRLLMRIGGSQGLGTGWVVGH
jgi:hypothetical protein